MNDAIFRLINNLAYKNIFVDQLMIFISKDLWYFYIAIVVLIFITGLIIKQSSYRKIVFSTLVFVMINLFLSFLIGNIYFVERPFVHNKVNLLYPHVADASFPSDHATGTMSIAVGLAKYNKLLSILLMITSFLVGISRVYVGHHYLLDILGAYVLVFATSFVYKLGLRDKVENLYETVEKKLFYKLINIKDKC
ncbi:phosphatase PAP2 family protein [Acetobacterium woodii]|nr:phosphatase PAP2 family protein [Acetobacterium woodii]